MHQRKKKSPSWAIPNPGLAYFTLLRKAIESTNSQDKEQLLGYVRSRSIRNLIEWASGVKPQLYVSPSSYFSDAGLAGLIKKVPFPPSLKTGFNPRETAIEKFREAEARCSSFNSKSWRYKNKSTTLHAQRYIRSIIGDSPHVVSILREMSVPSGACLGVHGSKTNHARKLLADVWTVTPRALNYGRVMCGLNDKLVNVLTGSFDPDPEAFSSAFARRVSITSSNRVSFVPKTAKVDRPIAVEPFINSMLQGCVDTFLRNRLHSRGGINLRDQTRNQELARQGSLGGSNPYSTIDLEAASDSLSIGLVKLLLPSQWYAFLADLRSDSYSLDGKTYVYHKFCSMGNGFCFPLESLIFAALIYGTMMSRVSFLPDGRKGAQPINAEVLDFSVYGDDIVVRQDLAHSVCETFHAYGLVVNSEKSFITGPFRESCGADWYLGQDVRPVVLTRFITTVFEACALHNSYYRSQSAEYWGAILQNHIRDSYPGFFMRPGREPGDTAFSVPLDVAMTNPRVRYRRPEQNWSWEELLALPVTDSLEGYVDEDLARVLNFSMMAGSKSHSPWNLRYTSKRVKSRICRPFRDDFHGLSFSQVTEPR